eukprot:TRINITY_DN8072_c0_g1_i5.p1 TRINITY_DN8072_c0_g1~~TRINITY_DN8072_c0_g1_i5.p1  ORF type:complete len:268 (+),score=54.83 TRINITY_DN8072_c0_g1_i5:74-805(+)
MDIFVRLCGRVDERTVPLEVQADWTVGHVRDALGDILPADTLKQCTLIWQGEELGERTAMLADLGICSQAVVLCSVTSHINVSAFDDGDVQACCRRENYSLLCGRETVQEGQVLFFRVRIKQRNDSVHDVGAVSSKFMHGKKEDWDADASRSMIRRRQGGVFQEPERFSETGTEVTVKLDGIEMKASWWWPKFSAMTGDPQCTSKLHASDFPLHPCIQAYNVVSGESGSAVFEIVPYPECAHS